MNIFFFIFSQISFFLIKFNFYFLNCNKMRLDTVRHKTKLLHTQTDETLEFQTIAHQKRSFQMHFSIGIHSLRNWLYCFSFACLLFCM